MLPFETTGGNLYVFTSNIEISTADFDGEQKLVVATHAKMLER